MKATKLVQIVVVTLLIVLAGQLSYAQQAKDMAIGVRATYNVYQEDDIRLFSTTFDTEYDNAVGFMINLTYFITDDVSLEFGVGYVTTDMDVDPPSGTTLGYGELSQIPLLLTGRYHFSAGDKLSPYIGLGIGYYLNDMENADSSGDFFEGAPSGVEAFADDGFGFHFVAGMDFFITDQLAFNLDLKYVWLDVDIGFDGAGYDEKDSTSLSSFVTGVGIKYYF